MQCPLANGQGSPVNEAVIGQTDLKIQHQSVFHGQPKSVFLAPVDSWGRGEIKGSYLVIKNN
jgi:hypothetical protein